HELTGFGSEHRIGDIKFIPYVQDPGTCESLGVRFGDIAYAPDFVNLYEDAIAVLRNVKIWIADAAAYNDEKNIVHANLKTIYRLNEQIGAERVYLTSLSQHMDYQTLKRELPEGYEPAWDGL